MPFDPFSATPLDERDEKKTFDASTAVAVAEDELSVAQASETPLREIPTSGNPILTPRVQVQSQHSDKWNQAQQDMTQRAADAGLPSFDDSRARLTDAISRAEKLGATVPHFIGLPNEPTGDRATSKDIETLVAALKEREGATRNAAQKAAIEKERHYWEQEAAQGMTAQQWKDQTGDPEPVYPIPPRPNPFPSAMQIEAEDMAQADLMNPPLGGIPRIGTLEANPKSPIPVGVQNQLNRAGAAVGNVGIGLTNFLASPVGMGTAGVGSAPGAIGRLVTGGFTADILRHVPELWEKVKEAEKTPPGSQERWDAGTNLVSAGIFSHALLKHFVNGGEAPSVPTGNELPQGSPLTPKSKTEVIREALEPQAVKQLAEVEKPVAPNVMEQTAQSSSEPFVPLPDERLDPYRESPVSSETVQRGQQTKSQPEPISPNLASQPTMITRAMEAELKARGFREEQVYKMKPVEASQILSEGESVLASNEAVEPTGVSKPKEIPNELPIIPESDLPYAGGEPRKTGVAQRVHEARFSEGQQGEVLPGKGTGTEALIEQGRVDLAKDPTAPERILSSGKPVSGAEMAILRARHEQLSRVTTEAERRSQANSSPQDKAIYETAFEAETDFARRIKPAATEASEVFRALQGETDIDTGSFIGLRRAVNDFHGRDVQPSEVPRLRKAADRVQQAKLEATMALRHASETVERQLRPKKSAPRSAEQLRAHFAERLRKLTPC